LILLPHSIFAHSNLVGIVVDKEHKVLFKKIARKLFVRLGIEIQKVGNSIAQATLPKFGNSPRNIVIELPRTIINPDRIFMGDDVRLGPGSLLYPITHYPTRWMQHPAKKQPQQKFDPKITIGNRVTATSNLQLAAFDKITIEDDVLFASNINITGGLHGYENANIARRHDWQAHNNRGKQRGDKKYTGPMHCSGITSPGHKKMG